MRNQKPITLSLPPEDYLTALRLKRKLKARTWSELFRRLVLLVSSFSASEIPELGEGPGELSRREFLASLERLLEPFERSPVAKVFDPELAQEIAHARETIKVLLQLTGSSAEGDSKKG